MEMCTFVCKVHDDSPAQQGGLKVGEFVLMFCLFPYVSCIKNSLENTSNGREGKCGEGFVQLIPPLCWPELRVPPPV